MAPAAFVSTDPLPPSRARRWRFAAAVFDERTLELHVDGEMVDIDRKPSEVLLYLLLHAGEVVTKDELLDAVWPRRILTETALTKCVARLREALRDDDQTIIRTIYGMGYRLVAAVHVEASVAPPTPHFDFHEGDSPPLRAHWKLLKRLGGGSHGEAWLAQHEKTAENRVFKFALDAPALGSLKREITLFRLLNDTLDERARIVRLLDWNLEQPPCFIEAEYISGGSLADWIMQQGGFVHISASQRLDFASQIADALAATHSVGVLHKDLKPSNVLIDIDDKAEPTIKLGDFGSGGMLDPDRLDALHITRLGFTGTVATSEGSGTLAYLAPEVLAGQPSTVQTDIYALGVILYQLVVGDLHRPLAPGWERDVDDELLREDIAAAADIDPSRRLSDAGELARRLRTLDARREQRLEDRRIEEMSKRAQLEAQQARQEMERLRARRTGMRVALAVLLGALIVSSVLFVDAQRARKRAETEATRAKAVSDFLNDDVLSVVSSGDTPVKDLTVKQLLDSASQQVDKRFGDQPEIAADIDHSLGMSYYRLDSAKEEQERFERGIARLEQSGHNDTPMALKMAGNLVWIDSDNGELEKNISHYEQILRRSETSLGLLNPDVIDLRTQLASAHAELGRWQLAADEQRAIVKDTEGLTPDDSKALGLVHLSYGWSLVDLAEFAEAEKELRSAYTLLEASGGEKNFESAKAHWRLGQLFLDMGRFSEAESELGIALRRFRAWQHDDGNLVIGVQLDQAQLLLYRRQPELAAAEAERLIGVLNARPAGENNQSAPIVEFLALAQAQSRQVAEAIESMRNALDRTRKLMASIHPDIRRTRMELADLLTQSGQKSEARETLGASPAVTFDDLPPNHPLRAELLRVSGLLDRDEGNMLAARDALTAAVRIFTAKYGVEHWRSKRAVAELKALP